MISIVCSSQYPLDNFKNQIMKNSGLHKDKIEFLGYKNNGEFSLTEIYNRGLKDSKYNIILFIHHDVEIETNSWGNKILKHFSNNPEYGILGLAGTTDMPLSGQWWEDKTKMVGIVNHRHNGKKWESKYSKNWGNDIVETLVVDGLFFAVHKERVKDNFDETVRGFHFYEITFVFSNYLKGVKNGVMFNIRVTHNSIGITNDEWDINRQEFVKKFNDDLPEKLVPNFYVPPKKINQNIKTKISVFIQSSGDIETFNKLYENIKSFDYPKIFINLITNEDSFDKFKDLSYDNVKIHEGFYSSLPKNLSILKFEDDILSTDDELVFFMNDNIVILNDIFSNFANLYSANKASFGCGFPLSYNKNKTVFASTLEIFANKDGKVGINMKDSNTYYNVCYGQIINSIGNLSDCLVTTPMNLKVLDWFKLNYETPLYFNEFSLRLSLKNKETFNDTNSLTIQNSYGNGLNIQNDFQNLVNFIGSDEKLKKLVKHIE